jgi:NAD(P)-dependent dehydrogenase (short-subunit alcohol dehydrogenase family)
VAAGAAVVVVGRDEARCRAAVELLGPQARTYTGDAVDPSTSQHAIQLAADSFGGFHALYHVAGGSGRARGDGPLGELTDEGWHYTLRWNLDSLFYANRAAVRHFLAAGQPGSILKPALVDTPMAKRAATDPDIMRYVATKQPLDGGRIGCGQDVDSAVVFFLSDESRFVTGQVLAVDGGWMVSDGQYPV